MQLFSKRRLVGFKRAPKGWRQLKQGDVIKSTDQFWFCNEWKIRNTDIEVGKKYNKNFHFITIRKK